MASIQFWKMQSPQWWRRSVYAVSTAERNMMEAVVGPPKRATRGDDWHDYTPEQYEQLDKAFGDITEYVRVGYSNYGGDILSRLVCDGLSRIHEKKESEYNAVELAIRSGSTCMGSGFGGETWLVWDKGAVEDLKKFIADCYADGEYLDAIFEGHFEDALTEFEQKMYDKEWDNLVETYPDLKGDAELEESVRLWLEGYGRVMATNIDYSEPKLMGVIGSSLVELHCKYSTTDEPLPFYWLSEEREKAIGDAEQLQAGDYRNTVERQICDAYDFALQELGYAYAKGDDEVKDFVETNRNLGWLPWNKHED